MASPPPRSATTWRDALARSGDLDQARSLCLESLRMAPLSGMHAGWQRAARRGRHRDRAGAEYGRAVTLCSAAESVLASKGIRWMPVERSALEACLDSGLARTGDAEAFELSRALGRPLDVDQAAGVRGSETAPHGSQTQFAQPVRYYEQRVSLDDARRLVFRVASDPRSGAASHRSPIRRKKTRPPARDWPK